MAIASIYNAVGGTLAQYDQVIEGLGAAASSPGGLVHIAAKTPDGFLVFDVWESMEPYEAFAPILAAQTSAVGLAEQGIPVLGEVVGLFANEHIHTLPAVAVWYRFPNLTAEGYRDIMRRVAFAEIPPTARRAHVAAETSEGVTVAAIWESSAAFAAFEPALQTAMAAAGLVPVAPVLCEIHRVLFSPAAAQSAHA